MIELRTAGNGTPRLHGLACPYDTPTRIGSEYNPRSFIEDVAPEAFRKCLSRGDLDCVLTVEHDVRQTLARTPLTLRLSDTTRGLEFDADLDMSDPAAQVAVSRIERGVLKECSFAFQIPPGGDKWSADETHRRITEATIHRGDVALTVYGANPNTGAEVLRGGADVFEQRRAFTEAIRALGVGGTGWEHRYADLLPSESRHAKYSDAEIAALGKKGQALRNPDGSFSFPIADREDLQNAIRAVGGRAQRSAPERVRVFIMHRAKMMGLGHLIPATWRADGTVSSPSGRSAADIAAERLLMAQGRALEAEFDLIRLKATGTSTTTRRAPVNMGAEARRSRQLEAEALALLAHAGR